jgi:hypothetical protein
MAALRRLVRGRVASTRRAQSSAATGRGRCLRRWEAELGGLPTEVRVDVSLPGIAAADRPNNVQPTSQAGVAVGEGGGITPPGDSARCVKLARPERFELPTLRFEAKILGYASLRRLT